MAVDMILDIEGVPGECKLSGFEGKIDIYSVSWGLSQAGTFHSGGGGGGGKANIQDVTVTKKVDKASALLMKNSASGKHYPTAKITVRKAGGDSPVEYFKVELEKVIVSALNISSSNGDENVFESVTLNFAKIKFEYTEQSEDGSGGAAQPFAWDVQKGVPG